LLLIAYTYDDDGNRATLGYPHGSSQSERQEVEDKNVRAENHAALSSGGCRGDKAKIAND